MRKKKNKLAMSMALLGAGGRKGNTATNIAYN